MRIKIAHMSGQFSDTAEQKAKDFDKVFTQAAEKDYCWVTGTESFETETKVLLKKAAWKHGYHIRFGGDCWVAVAKEIIEGEITTYWRDVIPGIKHVYSSKGVFGVTFRTLLGTITVMASHYPTLGDPTSKDTTRRVRIDKNKKLARAIGRYASRKAKGRQLVFYGGDQNIQDQAGDTFFGVPFTSCWDELGKYPSTGHGTIDVIASWDKDRRVKCLSARVLTDKSMALSTDHYFTEAIYDVRPL